MIKKVVIGSLSFILLYTGFVQVQVHLGRNVRRSGSEENASELTHRVYTFTFAKYTPTGAKEIEIEGDSANILTQSVDLINVVAKAYAEEVPVTITADKGNYHKVSNKVHFQRNVVATTENGTRLLTDTLDIHPEKKMMETEAEAEVKKDNINIKGKGAEGDSRLKKVRFKKNVTVVIQDPETLAHGPTIITCDGQLVIDYEKNIAHFKDNVTAEDARGKLFADVMDVYYNKVSRRVSKIVALGNVVIQNPDGSRTYSDSAIYLADEGRILLGGDTETIYFDEDDGAFGDDFFRPKEGENVPA